MTGTVDHHQSTLHVEFHIEENGYAFSGGQAPELYFGVTVDGASPVAFPTVVSPGGLILSAAGDGECDIFTCTCGISEDADITTGVQLAHAGDTVHWLSTYPALEARFARTHYLAALHDGLIRAEALVRSRPELDGWMPLRVEATHLDTGAAAAALFAQAVAVAATKSDMLVDNEEPIPELGDAAVVVRSGVTKFAGLTMEYNTIIVRQDRLVVRLQRRTRSGFYRRAGIVMVAERQLQRIRTGCIARDQPYPFPIALS